MLWAVFAVSTPCWDDAPQRDQRPSTTKAFFLPDVFQFEETPAVWKGALRMHTEEASSTNSY